jgi:hypothetical protein
MCLLSEPGEPPRAPSTELSTAGLMPGVRPPLASPKNQSFSIKRRVIPNRRRAQSGALTPRPQGSVRGVRPRRPTPGTEQGGLVRPGKKRRRAMTPPRRRHGARHRKRKARTKARCPSCLAALALQLSTNGRRRRRHDTTRGNASAWSRSRDCNVDGGLDDRARAFDRCCSRRYCDFGDAIYRASDAVARTLTSRLEAFAVRVLVPRTD